MAILDCERTARNLPSARSCWPTSVAKLVHTNRLQYGMLHQQRHAHLAVCIVWDPGCGKHHAASGECGHAPGFEFLITSRIASIICSYSNSSCNSADLAAK